MLKIALLATPCMALASTAAVDSVASTRAAAATAACLPCAAGARGPPRPAARSTRTATARSPPAELASSRPPAPSRLLARRRRDAGLDFKDAATEHRLGAAASLDHAAPQPLIPALLALGALVVLLRELAEAGGRAYRRRSCPGS